MSRYALCGNQVRVQKSRDELNFTGDIYIIPEPAAVPCTCTMISDEYWYLDKWRRVEALSQTHIEK